MADRKRSNWLTRRRATLLGLVLVVGYGAWQGWIWWLRHEPLGRAAVNIVDAFERQDLSTLWYYSDMGEKEAFHLDRERFDKVFREYIWPRAGGLKRVRTIKEGHPETEVYVITQLYAHQGREVFYDVVVFQTQDGPKANLITPGIFTTFDVKYGDKHRDLTGPPRWFATKLEGAIKDRHELEKLGITGIKDSPPEEPMISWDKHNKIVREYLENNGHGARVASHSGLSED